MSKKLLKNSFIFILGDILNRSVPFFMLPILTRYLTPDDYGIISIFSVSVGILSVFIGLSVEGAINVNFFQLTKEKLKEYIGNTIIILNISTILVLLIVLLFFPYILQHLKLEKEWLIVAVFLAFSQFFTTINMLLWTAEQNPKAYSFYKIVQTLITTILSILLVVGLGLGWEGQLLATSIASVLFSMISFIFILKRGYLIFKFNKNYLEDALKFGVPLVPHALSGWIKTGADRVVLMSLLGATATGIYSVGYQLGMVISIIVTAFNKAWSPYLFKILANNPSQKQKKQLVFYSYIYFIAIFFLAIVVSYILELIIPYFLGERFIQSSKYILYFSLAFAFGGMYFMVTNYIFFVKKTHILAMITFATAIIHIALLYILISLHGAIGAAEATLLSYIITFIVTWWLSNKVYAMPWKFWKSDV
ncbi:oligosaccharide flippase family protein [Sulfurimonas sp.]|uniref:lipopolysaccharide biosynthesis protein n=1 Tax=Sulfurimonas sp. TaxID=2022749 RepID=UPI002602956C|nr:oligosaccharide flippase family protein [Sulfurimonas sp.]